jgi:hypothetical protein
MRLVNDITSINETGRQNVVVLSSFQEFGIFYIKSNKMKNKISKYEANQIADKFIEECVDEGIISKIIKPEVGVMKDDMSPEITHTFIERPDWNYTWEDSGELTVTVITKDENDNEIEEIVVVDPNFDDINELEKRISSTLPEPPFSIDCGGFKTKQIEAKAFYVLCVLNKFRSDSFKEEIQDILKDYDFANMRSNTGKMVFKELLEEKMLENTKVLDLVVAACYLKLTAAEVKKDSELRDVLEQEDVEAYDALRALIKTDKEVGEINDKIKREGIKKWEKLKLIDERNIAISNIVSKRNDRLQMIYKVFNQSTDKVPQPIKDKILKKCKECVAQLKEEFTNLDVYEASNLLSKLKRRAMREQLRQIKASQLMKIKGKDYDNLFPKT